MSGPQRSPADTQHARALQPISIALHCRVAGSAAVSSGASVQCRLTVPQLFHSGSVSGHQHVSYLVRHHAHIAHLHTAHAQRQHRTAAAHERAGAILQPSQLQLNRANACVRVRVTMVVATGSSSVSNVPLLLEAVLEETDTAGRAAMVEDDADCPIRPSSSVDILTGRSLAMAPLRRDWT